MVKKRRQKKKFMKLEMLTKKPISFVLALIMFALVPMEIINLRKALAKTVEVTETIAETEEKSIHEQIEEKLSLQNAGMASLISFDESEIFDSESDVTEESVKTEVPEITSTPTPTVTPVPTSTPTPVPTATPIPTSTPKPTSTPVPTTNPNMTSDPYVWNGPKLTKTKGVNYGPSGKETYYNLNMKEVVARMRRMGFSEEEYPYWEREDGAKMLGPYVMVAANLNLRPRGSLVPCSLGMAIVCDTGGFARRNRTQLDIAVNWRLR